MELYEALETIKNECAKRAECVDCPFALGIAIVELLQMDFRETGIYKSQSISYLRWKQCL